MNSKLICDEISKVIKGKDEIIEKVLATIVAGGHVLLEDIPGVGKTTLAVAFAKTLGMEYNRVQFTPDVLPSDISGFSMYNPKTGEFDYKKGAAFCNLFLADEINRTSPKTQSALLEIMEEKKVTVDSVTRELPNPFTVIATENPVGSSGTQMLPESQLDRFMVRLSMGYPSHEAAIAILKGQEFVPLSEVKQMITKEELIAAQDEVSHFPIHDSVVEYIVNLVEATRENENFSLGASPRGAGSMLRMARAYAYLRGKKFVTPDEVIASFEDTLTHRVKLSGKAKAKGMSVNNALLEIRKSVNLPRT